MNKKMAVGILITAVGLIYSLFCFAYAVVNPWNYNGIGGLLGSFLGTQTLIPFILSAAVMCAGILLCLFEAYRKEK